MSDWTLCDLLAAQNSEDDSVEFHEEELEILESFLPRDSVNGSNQSAVLRDGIWRELYRKIDEPSSVVSLSHEMQSEVDRSSFEFDSSLMDGFRLGKLGIEVLTPRVERPLLYAGRRNPVFAGKRPPTRSIDLSKLVSANGLRNWSAGVVVATALTACAYVAVDFGTLRASVGKFVETLVVVSDGKTIENDEFEQELAASVEVGEEGFVNQVAAMENSDLRPVSGNFNISILSEEDFALLSSRETGKEGPGLETSSDLAVERTHDGIGGDVGADDEVVAADLPSGAGPYAAFVMDARTGQVLHSRNADTRLHPSSLTKMMTLYVAFAAINSGEINLDSEVKISRKAAAEPPSKLGLDAGQSIKLRYLLRAAAVKSANDAATAIGEAISGSEDGFSRRMNKTAKSLGMTATTFKNAHGLIEAGHLSTARDMSILGRRILYDFPEFYNMFSRISTSAGIKEVSNTNLNLLESYRGADGIKAGYSRGAGYNVVASAERGQERIVATMFGGSSASQRDTRIAELLDLGFQRSPTRIRENAIKIEHPLSLIRPKPRPNRLN